MRGFLWDPPRVPTYYNFAWVPHTFGGLTPPDPPPLFRTLAVKLFITIQNRLSLANDEYSSIVDRTLNMRHISTIINLQNTNLCK